MAYYQKRCKAGNRIRITNSYRMPRDKRDKRPRSSRSGNETNDSMKAVNYRNSANNLCDLIYANCNDDWYWCTLTYSDPQYNEGNLDLLKSAVKDFTHFKDRLKYQYEKSGEELIWLATLGYHDSIKHPDDSRIHHHLLIRKMSGDDYKTVLDRVYKTWGHGMVHVSNMRPESEYLKLAFYILKQGSKAREMGLKVKSYSKSKKGWKKPIISYERCPGETWSRDPEIEPGYRLEKDSLYEGVSPTGSPYQKYAEIRL